MRALVTGACGFVGGHLVRHLLEKGDQVLGTVFPPSELSAGQQERRFSFPHAVLDVSDAEACARCIAEYKPQVIYHLAGIAFVPEAEADFPRTLLVNVAAIDNIFRVCHLLENGTKVVLISSGEVYGKVRAADLPVTESTPIAPTNNYSLSKAMGELVAQRYARQGQSEVVILRPFNHIGPGQNNRFVASSFAWQLARMARGKQELCLQVGNLEARRDFSDVRDIVRAYRLAALNGHGVYNLGSGKAVSIREILHLLLEISGLDVRLKPDPARMRPSEVPEIYTSLDKARRELGWQPQIELRRTLSDVYHYWLQAAS